MPEVRPGIGPAYGAVTFRVHGRRVPGVFLVFDVENAPPGEEVPVAAVAGGHDAVKKVDAPVDSLDDVGGRPHAHEVAGLVLGHVLLHGVDGVVHLLSGLPHRQAPNGVAGQVQGGDGVHVVTADVLVGRALVDAEEHLAGVDGVRQGVLPLKLGLAPDKPAIRPLRRCLHVVVGRGQADALIEGHGDIRTQICLDADGILRRHEDPPPVDVGIESRALLGDLPELGQRKDLKSPGIGEDGALPVHKSVEAPQLPDEPIAGAQVQVIGVGKLDLALERPQVESGQAPLDGGLCAHIHKNGRLGGAVGTGEAPPAGAALGLQYLKHTVLPKCGPVYYTALPALFQAVT